MQNRGGVVMRHAEEVTFGGSGLDRAAELRGDIPALAALMQAYMGDVLSPHRQGFTALIGQAGEQVRGIYEADYRDFNRETYARGRETFDATYAAMKSLLIGAWRRDELAAREAAE